MIVFMPQMGTSNLLLKSGVFTPSEIDQLIATQNQVAAICGMVAFLLCLLVKIRQKAQITPTLLGPLVQASLASGGIVKALFLFFCGFHPEIFPKLSDLVVSLGVTSACMIFLYICTLISAFSKPKASP